MTDTTKGTIDEEHLIATLTRQLATARTAIESSLPLLRKPVTPMAVRIAVQRLSDALVAIEAPAAGTEQMPTLYTCPNCDYATHFLVEDRPVDNHHTGINAHVCCEHDPKKACCDRHPAQADVQHDGE